MKINLHIERLVLEGLPVTSGQALLVQSAVQEELARLLGLGPVAPQLMAGGAVPYARGSAVRFGGETGPRHLGTQIAQSVHEGLGAQSSSSEFNRPCPKSVF
jgi:hypothetical protein